MMISTAATLCAVASAAQLAASASAPSPTAAPSPPPNLARQIQHTWCEAFQCNPHPPPAPAAPLPPAPPPPDEFAIDDDVLAMLSHMSLEQKVGQMTQIDVTMLVSFTGDCGSFHWEDPSSCQPVLNRDRLEAWLRDYHVGSILNSPYGTGCIRDKCGWDVREWRAFVHEVQSVAAELGEPPILFGLDSVHGAGYVQGATVYPQQLNIGATFNRTAAFEFGRLASKDTRAAGVPWVFSPILGIATNPRWARVYETFGEDPTVSGALGVAVVEGIQHVPEPLSPDAAARVDAGVPAAAAAAPDAAPAEAPAGAAATNASAGGAAAAAAGGVDELPARAAACLKHFVAYSAAQSGLDRTPVAVPERQLLNYFVPPFAKAIDAGALTVMEGYHELNDVPVVASEALLQTLLRERLGFRGVLVTDWAEIKNLHAYHKVARSDEDAVLMSINSTSVDMSMVPTDNTFPRYLADLVRDGRIPEERVDLSAARILQLKKTLGLLSNPVPPLDLPFVATVGSAAARAASRALAAESIVLLKNEPRTGGGAPPPVRGSFLSRTIDSAARAREAARAAAEPTVATNGRSSGGTGLESRPKVFLS